MSMIGNLLRVTRTELEAYLKDSSLLENRIYNEEDEDPNLVDIDKSWEGILFMLTGQTVETYDHPMARVLFSGQMIDEDQDLGYGPGHYLMPEEVKELNAKIATITTEEFSSNYDAAKMTELEIYPNVWAHEEMVDYLSDYFKTIQDVFAEAVKNDEAIITFIN